MRWSLPLYDGYVAPDQCGERQQWYEPASAPAATRCTDAACNNGIQGGNPVFIILLQGINVADLRVHDRPDGLSRIVGMIETQGMTKLVEDHPPEIL